MGWSVVSDRPLFALRPGVTPVSWVDWGATILLIGIGISKAVIWGDTVSGTILVGIALACLCFDILIERQYRLRQFNPEGSNE